MTHYKQLLDPGKYLGPQDFTTPREVTISRITRETVKGRGDEPEAAFPMLYILAKDGTEYPRPYKVPKSVLYGLSIALGTNADDWKGKKITLMSAWCMAFGDKEEAVRVKFEAGIDAKIVKWMKKRKASASAYMITNNA